MAVRLGIPARAGNGTPRVMSATRNVSPVEAGPLVNALYLETEIPEVKDQLGHRVVNFQAADFLLGRPLGFTDFESVWTRLYDV